MFRREFAHRPHRNYRWAASCIPVAQIEVLEDRTPLTLLIPTAETSAEAVYFSLHDGPNTDADPVQATSSASVRLSPGTGDTSGAQADASASSVGNLTGFTLVFATKDVAGSPTTHVVATSASRGVANWVINGPVNGTPVTIDLQIQVSGLVAGKNFSLFVPFGQASADLEFTLTTDTAPDFTLFDGHAAVNDLGQFTESGGWTFTQDTTLPTDTLRLYSVNTTITRPFTLSVGETFSIEAVLSGRAFSGSTQEIRPVMDFLNNGGGVSYSFATPAPGISVVPAGRGGSVSGTVFHDENADGAEDPGEQRLLRQRMFLDVNQNGTFDAADLSGLTDANGQWFIPGVPAGMYDVWPVLLTGWAQTTPVDAIGNPIPARVQVTDGTSSVADTFGLRALPAEVRGVLWNDANGDDVRDGAEPLLEGWTVFADLNQDGMLDANEPSVVSDAAGSYSFTGLLPGTLDIVVTVPADWVANNPPPTLTVVAGQRIVRDLGFRQSSEFSGIFFDDANANGQREQNESPLAGWLVFIDDDDDGFLDAAERWTVTNAQGEYRFRGVLQGAYNVTAMIWDDSEWWPTTPGRTQWAMFQHNRRDLIPTSARIRAADLNNDGHEDLIFGDLLFDFFVALNSPTSPGQFLPRRQLTMPAPYSAGFVWDITDFSGDGLPDLLVEARLGGLPAAVGVFRNDSTDPGSFLPFELLLAEGPDQNISRPFLANLNGDALPDAVVQLFTTTPGTPTVGEMYGLLNNGSRFAPPSYISPGYTVGFAEDVFVDLNYDGFDDLLNNQQLLDRLLVSFNDPANPGVFAAAPIGIPDTSIYARIVDVNADGFVDLISQYSRNGRNSVTAALNEPARPGQFRPAQHYAISGPTDGIVPSGSVGPLVQDLNGDGLPDILSVITLPDGNYTQSSQFDVLLNTPGAPGTFQPAMNYQLPVISSSYSFETRLVDLNGDGYPDLFASPPVGSSQIPIFLNRGDGTFGQAILLDSGGAYGGAPHFPDLNGDGLPEILHHEGDFDARDRNVRIHVSDARNPGSFTASHVIQGSYRYELSPAFPSRNPQPAHDLNSDGKDDILLAYAAGIVHSTSSVTVVADVTPDRPTILDFGFRFDTDRDGVTDAVEAAGPNNGDINSDGIPDSQQNNVASLPNSTDGSYVGFESPAGTTLSSVRAVAGGPAPPAGVTLPDGQFSFQVEGVTPGGAVDVLMFRESAVPITDFHKFGPTPDNTADHWYAFNFSSVNCLLNGDCTGMAPVLSAEGNVHVLHFLDGGRGDADLTADGIIIDPGGPAVVEAPSLEVEIDGPELGVRGQPLEYALTASIPGNYRYEIDWSGDGVPGKSIVGDETTIAKLFLPTEGDYEIHVTALSLDSELTADATTDVAIEPAAIIDGDLLIGGTTGHDVIIVSPRSGNVSVRINGVRLPSFTLGPDANVNVRAQSGNDFVWVSPFLPHDTVLHGDGGNDTLFGGSRDDLLSGGAGNDRLFGGFGDDLLRGGSGHDSLFGGFGNDILLGDAGNDWLFGNHGRDVLIGGEGRDWLFGGADQDIVIGDATTFDNNNRALFAIRAEWTSNKSRRQRIANLTDGSGSSDAENGNTFLLPGTTVLDDGLLDHLFADRRSDWLFGA